MAPRCAGLLFFTLCQAVISRQWLNFSNGYGKRSLANTGVNGKVAPEPVIREFLPVPVGISTMRIGSGRSGLLGRDKPRPGRQSVLVQVHFSLGSIDVS
jgi:hypothetical protein